MTNYNELYAVYSEEQDMTYITDSLDQAHALCTMHNGSWSKAVWTDRAPQIEYGPEEDES